MAATSPSSIIKNIVFVLVFFEKKEGHVISDIVVYDVIQTQ